MTDVIQRVVVLGGGSAGWIAAGLIASRLKQVANNTTEVVLVESPDVKTIGVGEGSWPTLRSTLAQIGIDEARFVSTCDASFKQGTEFIGWRGKPNSSGQDRYYHPFTVPYCYSTDTDIIAKWLGSDTLDFAKFSSPQALLCDFDKAPKTLIDPSYAGFVNYGFHFNADKLGELLKSHCRELLGVTYLSDHVEGVVESQTGDIDRLVLQKHGELSGDLFIDCSGLKSVLIGEHYKVKWQAQSSVLFNNRAIAIQTPYEKDNSPIPSSTRSTATDFGWDWDISLRNRRGTGIVYSDQYCSDEEAEARLRKYLVDTSGNLDVDSLSARKIQFEPGYREKFWHKNCVAVGMSSGFIEPLEASAIVMVELSSQYICRHLPMTKKQIPVVAQRFNQLFTYRWQRIIDFIKYHYVLSDRTSAYWQAHRESSSIPESLQALMTLWQNKGPEHSDFWHHDEIFSAASYQYVLAGMANKTEFNIPSSSMPSQQTRTQQEQQQLRQQSQQLAERLPTNRDLLESIVDHYNANQTNK